MTAHEEHVLADGGVTRVVRVGNTVRRPVRPFTQTVQAYLRRVRAAGVDFVPEPLGYDEQGREVLSYVAGDVPVEPLPAWATTDAVLIALASMIRRLHDAASGWSPPAEAVWGTIPGLEELDLSPLFDVPELVSHQDYCPGNVVFNDGLPAGLIDFDLARPTTRVADCVNALSWWVPLKPPVDRPPALARVDAGQRVRVFADAYGMTTEQRVQVVPVALQRSRNTVISMQAAAQTDPVFTAWWEEGLKDRLPRAADWLEGEAEAIQSQLLD